jgi:hypothetical protein
MPKALLQKVTFSFCRLLYPETFRLEPSETFHLNPKIDDWLI